MKINWKNPWVIAGTVIGSILLLVGIITLSFNLGEKNALEKELIAINEQLKRTSSRVNPDEHLKLLAKKKAIEGLLGKN